MSGKRKIKQKKEIRNSNLKSNYIELEPSNKYNDRQKATTYKREDFF
jgi:hypothetical protein